MNSPTVSLTLARSRSVCSVEDVDLAALRDIHLVQAGDGGDAGEVALVRLEHLDKKAHH